MAQMMSQMNEDDGHRDANNQTKTVGQWKCSGYDVALNMMMMPMKMSVWASTDVPFDVEKFQKLYANVLKAQLRLDDAAVAEMMKVKGYWISTEMNAEIMGAKMHNTSEVVEISNKTAPARSMRFPPGIPRKTSSPCRICRTDNKAGDLPPICAQKPGSLSAIPASSKSR